MKNILLVSAMVLGLAVPNSALAGDDAVAAIIGGVIGYHIGKHHGREREPRYYPEPYTYRQARRICDESAPRRYPQYYRHMKNCMDYYGYAWYDEDEYEYHRNR